jgi:hypothetical protein
MVAAQRFNLAQGNEIPTIYGGVNNGIQGQFLKLEGRQVMLDLTIYPLPSVDRILGFLVWMMRDG